MTDQLEGQVSLFDQDTWFGKMSQGLSQATVEKTSRPSSKKSSKLSNRNVPICLRLSKRGGAVGASQDVCTTAWEDGQLLGEYTMHSFGESPREENASHLSQILEDSAQPKYYLSGKACRGILNRAEKRCKELPDILRQALESQANDPERDTE